MVFDGPGRWEAAGFHQLGSPSVQREAKDKNKIGEIMDVLVDKSGKIAALIVGVGGFLGAGEKDVAVPFEAVTLP
jgi:PRC-barrel domain